MNRTKATDTPGAPCVSGPMIFGRSVKLLNRRVSVLHNARGETVLVYKRLAGRKVEERAVGLSAEAAAATLYLLAESDLVRRREQRAANVKTPV